MPTLKTCSCAECPRANRPQSINNFGINNSAPDGKHWYCLECANRKQREWKAANQEKIRKWRRTYIAGIKAKNKQRGATA